ncbi:hypothetical protein HPCPY3281_1346 [Helicobacter pylori CPY3281]|nr:hypothetical protein HPCPY3281_1346 [Helicobacter pylori CPY3281]
MVKTIKTPFKTTQAEISNVFSVWALHSQNEKRLDFSGDFLSVIRGLVFQNTPETPPFFFETTKRQISAKILPIHAILTKSCDRISNS